MKKQALAFFTMFSLILMLSIYYITLPKEVSTTKKSESVISSLNEDSKKSKETTKENNDQVISDPDSSEKDKTEAISENEQLKENAKKEEEIKSSVKALGYENTVEIKDKTLYISVLNEKADDKIARSIMKTLYEKTNNAFFIEVSFK